MDVTDYRRRPARAPAVLVLAVLVLAVLFIAASCSSTGASGSPGTVATTDPTTTVTTPGVSTTQPPAATDTTQDAPTTVSTATPESTSTLSPLEPPTFESLEGINTITDFSGLTSGGSNRWQQSVPGVEDIRITSTADGADQPALWLAPGDDGKRPLLVILHSWSSGYLQHAGIPYAMWAQENGWAVIAPQFRGVNDDPDAIGSDLAVQDVADAIDYATSQDGVDADRVYAVGYSGGGMMSLLLAGRHPDKVTAVAAWGPPYDLVEFYRQSAATGRHYAGDLRAGCGGDPTDGGSAREECVRRSPMTYLDTAREQGVPVFIGQGIFDSLLSPRHGATAFNQLADPEDRLSDGQVDEIGQGSIPEEITEPISTETFFGEGDPAPVFARRSGSAWLVLFGADHDMVYHATLRWLASDPR